MGTKTGETAKAIIENSEEKITPTICLTEVYSKTLKVEGQELAEKQKNYIKKKVRLYIWMSQSPWNQPKCSSA